VIGCMPAAAIYFRDPDAHLLDYFTSAARTCAAAGRRRMRTAAKPMNAVERLTLDPRGARSSYARTSVVAACLVSRSAFLTEARRRARFVTRAVASGRRW
jgi:hypothetical protein